MEKDTIRVQGQLRKTLSGKQQPNLQDLCHAIKKTLLLWGRAVSCRIEDKCRGSLNTGVT